PAMFHTAGGPVVARYMHGDGFTAARARGWTALTLPYRGRRLSMIAMLPPGRATPACRVPGAATVSALVSSLARSRSVASIALPKVKLASAEPLKDVLTALGMGVAFNQEVAHFAGISPQACCIAFV